MEPLMWPLEQFLTIHLILHRKVGSPQPEKGEKEHRTSKRNQNKGTRRTAADTELKQLPAGSSGVSG